MLGFKAIAEDQKKSLCQYYYECDQSIFHVQFIAPTAYYLSMILAEQQFFVVQLGVKNKRIDKKTNEKDILRALINYYYCPKIHEQRTYICIYDIFFVSYPFVSIASFYFMERSNTKVISLFMLMRSCFGNLSFHCEQYFHRKKFENVLRRAQILYFVASFWS